MKQWFLKFSIRLQGETSVGDPVDIKRPIEIQLYTAEKADAEKQAKFLFVQLKSAAKGDDTESLKKYCKVPIDSEDRVTLDEFELISVVKTGKTNKKSSIEKLKFEKLVASYF